MSKFASVKKLSAQASDTARYELSGIGSMPDAVLIGKPATRRANPAYANAIMAASTKLQRKLNSSKDKAGVLTKYKDSTRAPIVTYVLVGWENVFDDEGKEVKFTPENAFDLIISLPDYLFDDLTNFFEIESNFGAEEAEDVLGNAKN